MTDTTLTERCIQLSIHRERVASSKIICPNYTPRGWWECDLWQVTKSGYATEYEIKITLSDFKNDARKQQVQYEKNDGWKKYTENKHDLLSAGCDRGPSRFFYCVPKSLVEQIEPLLPDWAGLISFFPVEGWHLSLARVRKDAPRLHRVKVDSKEIELCKSRIVYRYWNAINDLHKATEGAA